MKLQLKSFLFNFTKIGRHQHPERQAVDPLDHQDGHEDHQLSQRSSTTQPHQDSNRSERKSQVRNHCLPKSQVRYHFLVKSHVRDHF